MRSRKLQTISEEGTEVGREFFRYHSSLNGYKIYKIDHYGNKTGIQIPRFIPFWKGLRTLEAVKTTYDVVTWQ